MAKSSRVECQEACVEGRIHGSLVTCMECGEQAGVPAGPGERQVFRQALQLSVQPRAKAATTALAAPLAFKGILGGVMGLSGAHAMDAERLDQVRQITLREMNSNPIIDREIRRNRVIMRELEAAVARSAPEELARGTAASDESPAR